MVHLKLRARRLGSIRNKNNWNNASKRLFGSYSHSGIPGFHSGYSAPMSRIARIYSGIHSYSGIFPNERALNFVIPSIDLVNSTSLVQVLLFKRTSSLRLNDSFTRKIGWFSFSSITGRGKLKRSKNWSCISVEWNLKTKFENCKLPNSIFHWCCYFFNNFTWKRLAVGYTSLFYLPVEQHVSLLEDEEVPCKG